MERTGAGFKQLGLDDLAKRQAALQAELQRRTGLKDFSLRGSLLPEGFTPEPARLHPCLEGNLTHKWLLVNGGRSKQELLSTVSALTAGIGSNAQFMSESSEFTTQPESHTRELVVAPVGVLVPHPRGHYATTVEIEQARDEKGLEPVYAETAHQILLQHGDDLKVDDVIWMSMKPIAGRSGGPGVFGVARGRDGLWLYGYWAGPSGDWDPEDRFAFFLPQVTKAA